LKPGIDFLIKYSSLESQIKDADLVISGEGRADHQSISGKVISGIAKICRRYQKAYWVVAGQNLLSPSETMMLGISRLIPLVDKNISITEAMTHTHEHLKRRISSEFKNFLS
jgi:glycerate 2-kinase